MAASALPKKAIAYYRHSAEDKQENSVLIQREHAVKFAAAHEIAIIHEEADEGESGLLAARPAFQKLFKDWIRSESAPSFDYIFVYDVTRWGRFQDQDEAAYYEFECKRYGKEVIYISRGFSSSENKLLASLQTSIERYMAADFSRQLSSKVFFGSIKIAQSGLSVGGKPCFGYSRLLLDEKRERVQVLLPGQHKVVANQRVTFIPTEDTSTTIVREIFTLYAQTDIDLNSLANRLNFNGFKSPSNLEWDVSKIRRILTNQTYTGTLIYNKTSSRLKTPSRKNPRSDWIICENAFLEIVSRDIFSAAQRKLALSKHNLARRKEQISNIVLRFRERCEAYLRTQDVTAFKVQKILNLINATASVAYLNASGLNQWYFRISENHSSPLFTIVLGIEPVALNKISKVFCIPHSQFARSGLMRIESGSEFFNQYQTDEPTVLKLIFKHLTEGDHNGKLPGHKTIDPQ
jgi:DNA invertase Pin-like site-specific DNA recombinase